MNVAIANPGHNNLDCIPPVIHAYDPNFLAVDLFNTIADLEDIVDDACATAFNDINDAARGFQALSALMWCNKFVAATDFDVEVIFVSDSDQDRLTKLGISK